MITKLPDEEAIFKVACQIPTSAARADYLNQVCGDDPARLDRMRALLRVHDEESRFLISPPPGIAATLDTPSPKESVGSHIGPYKLLEQIGEGGMGLVYMAEQQRPVRRLVALKLVKPGMGSTQVIVRFEAERQALALMDHPNIAKVLDAGTTETGHPYFVMELVRGMPVNEFCDQKRLTVRERLQLHIGVCQAVQHAHEKGVIHRDLKPTNVLVTMHDSVAVPKVIDFGIAKALGQPLTEHTLHTGFTQLVGTPLYMSPEQAELNQLGVDTRSDIYSLGVMLYELLTGTTPFDKEALTKVGFDEMRRIIREEEPPRPSTRVSTLAAAILSTVSDRRSIDPRRISIALRGELDWIVMKALEKNRAERYESASALARDIERFLADEQVQACPPTAAYRFRKFAKKHRAALSTGLLVAASLLMGIVLSTWQAVRATTAEAQATVQRDEAQKQRGEAQTQRDAVKALNDQLRRTLYSAEMNVAYGAWQTGGAQRVRDLLEKHRPREDETDLRGFEWHFLYRLSHGELLTLPTRKANLAYSPDGKRLASGTKIWDALTGQELVSFGGAGIDGLAFSPDGKRLAGSPGIPGKLRVWNAETGEELLGLERTFNCIAYSPDGKLLASPGPPGNIVRIWDAQSGEVLFTLPGHKRTIHCVAFSTDGQRVAAGSDDRTVRVWSLHTREQVVTCRATSSVTSVAFSPDDERLVAASDDHTVRVWNAHTGQELFSVPAHNEWLADHSVAFSPDGKRLAGADQQSVKVWDAQTGEELLAFYGHTDLVGSVAFSPDGKHLASASTDGTLRVWDAQAIQKPQVLRGRALSWSCLAFSPDCHRLASAGPITNAEYPPQDMKIWDTKTGQEIFTLKAPEPLISTLAFSRDGKYLASGGGGDSDTSPPEPGEIVLWDALTGAELHTLKDTVGFFGVAFSPDGKCLAAGSSIWDQATRRYVSGVVKVWDVQTGQELQSIPGHASWVHSVVYSPDGKRLASASLDKTVKLWDPQTGQEIVTCSGHTRSVNSLAFSSDSKRLASASDDNTVKIWNAQSGEEILTLQGHTHYVSRVAFSPDGKRLATTSDDKTVKLWNAQTGEELITFKAPARIVAFSQEGHQLFACSPSGELTVYDATPLTNAEKQLTNDDR
jgi:WD40 repeat protein/serine/threonine protein kinase